MKRIGSLFLSFVMIFALAACGQSAASEKQEEIQPAAQKTDEPIETSQDGVTVEQSATEEQTDTEMETEPSESISIAEQEEDVNTKILVVYFSCTGTTKPLAEYAAEILGRIFMRSCLRIRIRRLIWHITPMGGRTGNKTIQMRVRKFLAVWRIWMGMIL